MHICAGHDSVWQEETTYTDIGLVPDTQYCYRVKARDSSPLQNETDWSDPCCAITLPPEDTIKPEPDPAEWGKIVDANNNDGRPHQVYGGLGELDYWAEMWADEDTYDESGVEYKFVCTSNSRFSSGGDGDPGPVWRNEDNVIGDPGKYIVKVGGQHVDANFYVIVRDRSPNQNMTGPSEVVSWRE